MPENGWIATVAPRPANDPAGLAVDPHQPGLQLARVGTDPAHRGQEAGDDRGADQRLPRSHRLAAVVGVEDGVLGEHLLQRREVALLGGREEPLEQGVAGVLVGVEPGAIRLQMLARPRHELSRVHLGSLDDLRDLRVLVAEHLAQEVGRPLDGSQPFEEDEHRERQGVGELCPGGRAGRRILHERLRQPRPPIR